MTFDPITAAIRFGSGLSPRFAPPSDLDALLDQARRPDRAAEAFPIQPFEEFVHRMAEYRTLVKRRRDTRGTADFEAARKAANVYNKAARQDAVRWMGHAILRRTRADDGLRERLTGFWADHFTAFGKGGIARWGGSSYVETSIRPHVMGRFDDMLVEVIRAPLMLMYLDQDRSIGPNSQRGLKLRERGKPAGLNENLAREVLELHTLGVDGPYTQADVTQLAELFTGMDVQPPNGFNFRRNLAEPGAETVLGRTYGGGQATFADVEAALRDLAAHPATAAHIARKMAVHFVSDTPDPGLVQHLEARFLATDGDLGQVTQALLEHPAAWSRDAGNVKQPFDFVASAFRALDLGPEAFDGINERQALALLHVPMSHMGQTWQRPAGPDGFPEEDSAWITPQGLAARLRWAVSTPAILIKDLPDPRDFVETALGPRAPDAVRFAARASESVREGIGLILTSPAFQRT